VVRADTTILARALLDFSLLLMNALIWRMEEGIDSSTVSAHREKETSSSMLVVAFLSFSSFAASRTACERAEEWGPGMFVDASGGWGSGMLVSIGVDE
jgi:hypothetical protein